MIGDGYWATGIVLTPRGPHKGGFGWDVQVDFYDDGFCDEDSTEGTVRHRYVTTDVVRAAQVVKADAERLGIRFRDAGAPDGPSVYVDGDGERTDLDYPANWREVAAKVARALEWDTSCVRLGDR